MTRPAKIDPDRLRAAAERQQRLAAYYAAKAELAAATQAALAESKSGEFHMPPDELYQRVGDLARETFDDRAVTVTEAARQTGIPVSTVRAWCADEDNYILRRKVGNEWRIELSSLIAYAMALMDNQADLIL
ncbi:helix-turn-helix domain-containing protein [Caldilinea sp.]|uniref:helix-turn-helix domain-containing protein n=1 Tax=Caldilinea sp. TaxID=2293560 RepID=UPI002CF1D25A|nr:helix-turn-helix domain-containing protein [Caldilinea sp.]HRA67753.1 helix-turn-helix domain-containing protein [Caldilinea sp.]